MKKKIWITLMALMLLLGAFNKVEAQEDRQVKLLINNEYIESDVSPFIQDERTLVPIRVISEVLGYEVGWDEGKEKVTISNFDEAKEEFSKIFVLTINKKTVVEFETEKVNQLFRKSEISDQEISEKLLEGAKSSKIDVAPTIKEERTFVPIRLVAELMGEEVQWDEENWTVIIKSNK